MICLPLPHTVTHCNTLPRTATRCQVDANGRPCMPLQLGTAMTILSLGTVSVDSAVVIHIYIMLLQAQICITTGMTMNLLSLGAVGAVVIYFITTHANVYYYWHNYDCFVVWHGVRIGAVVIYIHLYIYITTCVNTYYYWY